MAVSDWSTTASLNLTVGGIDIAENCARANMNNMGRAIMAEAKGGFQEVLSVKAYGALGDGTTNDTSAINSAISAALALSGGATVYFPAGSYAVTEINATAASAIFTKRLRLVGAGAFCTKIVPFAAGGVLLNLMGRNYASVENLQIDSTALASQCGIFMCRTATSANCNNNNFRDVWVTGSYTVASVVSNGAESTSWFGCRIENSNTSPLHKLFFTGSDHTKVTITAVNGGTQASGPNTDNVMTDCEFYAPYTSARPITFSASAGYTMSACTVICGSVNTARLITYQDPVTAVFNGPVTWISCHFEVIGTGNVIHYLDGGAVVTYWNGINQYGGFYVVSSSTYALDYDRTNILVQPIIQYSTWLANSIPNGTADGINFYVYAMTGCNIHYRLDDDDGTIIAPGFVEKSFIEAAELRTTNLVSTSHYEIAGTVTPASGTFGIGTVVRNAAPAAGQPVRWHCTAAGTMGTLGAITATTTANSNVVTVNSATGLYEGAKIAIATATGGPWIITKISGTTLYLQTNVTNAVTTQAVTFSAGTFVPEYALANQGAVVADASGGATVDTEARTAINALLARIRTTGLIAT